MSQDLVSEAEHYLQKLRAQRAKMEQELASSSPVIVSDGEGCVEGDRAKRILEALLKMTSAQIEMMEALRDMFKH